MSDEQFTTAIALRLGAPVCSTHLCVCGTEVERSAQHALVCNKLKSRHARHRLGNDIIFRALKAADVPTTLEPLGLSRTDGKGPDGASVLPWKAGKALVWDFTCVHRLAASYMEKASHEGSTVADAAEAKKSDKYKDISPPCAFHPVAIETLGGLGTETLSFLCEVGSHIAGVTGDTRATLFFAPETRCPGPDRQRRLRPGILWQRILLTLTFFLISIIKLFVKVRGRTTIVLRSSD